MNDNKKGLKIIKISVILIVIVKDTLPLSTSGVIFIFAIAAEAGDVPMWEAAFIII